MPALRPPTKATLDKYGLTVTDWWALYNATRGKCPCCSKSYTQKRRPAVDHEHATGRVRGLICSPCNLAIGFRHDNAGWFRNVANYLAWPTAAGVQFEGTALHVDTPGGRP